jgi:hypothetical protein
VEVRQGKEENYKPELFVVPDDTRERGAVRKALERKVAALQNEFPGVALQAQEDRFWIPIPEGYRVGHEAHFGQVARQFLRYLEEPASLPAWEKPNMLSKYYVTTEGVRRAQQP